VTKEEKDDLGVSLAQSLGKSIDMVKMIVEVKMAEYLSRDDILNASDIQTEEVAVPEWGAKKVLVRGLTGTERDAFEEASLHRYGKKGQNKEINLKDFRARLISWSIIDKESKRIFSDADVPALGRKSAAALQRVFDVASRLSGLSESDVDELVKNSPGGQSDDSGSS
jgi:hypothetical protein